MSFAKFFFGILIPISILQSLNGQNLHFNKLYPDYNGDLANCVIVQDDGYLIAGGGWSDSFNTYASIKFIKTDKVGNLLWRKAIGEVGKGYYLGIDGSYIQSQFSNSSYVISTVSSQGKMSGLFMKLDSNFDTIWTRTVSDTSNNPDVKQFSTGIETREGYLLGVGVVGHKISNVSFTGDILVVKSDSLGNILWEKNFRRSAYDWGFRVLQTNDGGYLIASVSGSLGLELYLLKLDQNGNETWGKVFRSSWNEGLYPGIIACRAGGYYIWGSNFDDNQTPANPNPSFDKLTYVAKIDENGNEEWRTNLHRSYYYTSIYKLIELGNGDLLFCGDKWVGGHNGVSKGWVAKMDQYGDIIWERYFLNSGHMGGSVMLNDIKSVADTLIVCTGAGYVPDDSGGHRQDVWLLALDARGCLNINCATGLFNDIAVLEAPYSIYPNPTRGFFSLQGAIANETVEIIIYSLSGQKLWSEIVYGDTKVISELPSGSYIYEVKDQTGRSHFGKMIFID